MEKYKKLIIIGSSLGIVGLILSFFSVSFGTSLADNWLHRLGGADTWKYELVMQSNINTFLVIGSILFSVSLVSIIFSLYKMLALHDK
ncbi:hypothetical protein ABFY48_20225 [Lysinibacillus pakistanensis]|uniref:hypothetical protein n=1 Tax=Lysinibacillus pakistanensis TaxID=759811 RepID=UPI003D2D5292